MELELILTELRPFELSHLATFCIVGYEVCVNNFFYNFQWTIMNYAYI